MSPWWVIVGVAIALGMLARGVIGLWMEFLPQRTQRWAVDALKEAEDARLAEDARAAGIEEVENAREAYLMRPAPPAFRPVATVTPTPPVQIMSDLEAIIRSAQEEIQSRAWADLVSVGSGGAGGAGRRTEADFTGTTVPGSGAAAFGSWGRATTLAPSPYVPRLFEARTNSPPVGGAKLDDTPAKPAEPKQKPKRDLIFDD